MLKIMNTQNWISLFEYSAKHGVSLSTLRRRIKANTIPYKLESGKYFLLDESPKAEVQDPIRDAGAPSGFTEASVLASANRLVEELKLAYAKILQEKEEQITILKEEIVDLKMLVSLLEKQVNALTEVDASPLELSHNEFLFPEISE